MDMEEVCNLPSSATSSKPQFLLLVGGSGYLGLHLLQAFSQESCSWQLAFTYFSHHPPPSLRLALPHARAFKVDLQSGEGLDAIAATLGPPWIVINCAAISVPRECESNPSLAAATNVPQALVWWLSSFAGIRAPLLIHLSTDQVYEGTKSYYKEDDETKPVNVYGKSKLEAEQFIMKNWPNYAILRSSIIYGPNPIVRVEKSLPVQWMNEVLSTGKGAEFFQDEYRCPVFVNDVVKVVKLVIKKASGGEFLRLLLNVGGPQRLSRAEMAELVADVQGFEKSLVKHISAAAVNRGVPSPPDISMDVSRLISLLDIVLTPFSVGVKSTLQTSSDFDRLFLP